MTIMLVSLGVLLLLSALSAASEVALLSLDALKLEARRRAGSRTAAILQRLRSKPQRTLTTLLIVNNMVNTAIATLATTLTISLVGTGEAGGPQQASGVALTVASLIVAIVITIVGDLIPKTVGAVSNVSISSAVSFPLHWIDRLLTPLHWVLTFFVTPVVRLLTGGRDVNSEVPTREEMGVALTLAHAGGELHSTDLQVAKEALHFSTIDLGDVMTPRVDVASVPETATFGEALLLMRQTGFSRLPVCGRSLDEVLGIVLIKDLTSVLDLDDSDGISSNWFSLPVTSQMREVAFLPETKSIVDALAELRRMRSHMAIVVDEHGGTAGVVTLEDILEELIGDIRDESDPESSVDIVHRSEGHLIVAGRARLEVTNLMTEGCLENVDSSTVGGLMMERLGRPVVVGDVVQIEQFTLTALNVMRNRVKLVRIDYPDADTSSEAE